MKPWIIIGAMLLFWVTPAVAQDDAAGWNTIMPGLDYRFAYPGETHTGISLAALRIDPAYFDFRVHYTPTEAQATGAWLQSLPGARAFINGNFFGDSYLPEGLLVSDSREYGRAFEGYGGIFGVVDGQPRIISTIDETYESGSLSQAIQGAPMLVIDGQANPESGSWNDELARRSVIALDDQGRVLFIATSFGSMRLDHLSQYLAEDDNLNIVDAINLDGGVSTTLFWLPDDPEIFPFMVRAIEPVPVILAAYRR